MTSRQYRLRANSEITERVSVFLETVKQLEIKRLQGVCYSDLVVAIRAALSRLKSTAKLNLGEVFRAQAFLRSNKVFIRWVPTEGEEETYSFAQVNKKMNQVARVVSDLIHTDFSQGGTANIAIIYHGPEHILVLGGSLYAGFSVTPLNVSLNAEQIAERLVISNSDVIIISAAQFDTILEAEAILKRKGQIASDKEFQILIVERGESGKVIPSEQRVAFLAQFVSSEYNHRVRGFYEAIEGQKSDDFVLARTEKDSTAIVAMTSGSTGYPKGVFLPHTVGYASLVTGNPWYKMSEDDTIYTTSHGGWGLFMRVWMMAAFHGATLLLSDRGNVYEKVRVLAKESATLIATIPPVIFKLGLAAEIAPMQGTNRGGTAAAILSTGSTLPSEWRETFEQSYDLPVKSALALTETGPIAADIRFLEKSHPALVKEYKGYMVLLPGPDYHVDEMGMLYIGKGYPTLLTQYVYHPDDPRNVGDCSIFKRNCFSLRGVPKSYFCTGDILGNVIEIDGMVLFNRISRKDNVLKLKGAKLATAKVLRSLKKVSGIQDVHILPSGNQTQCVLVIQFNCKKSDFEKGELVRLQKLVYEALFNSDCLPSAIKKAITFVYLAESDLPGAKKDRRNSKTKTLVVREVVDIAQRQRPFSTPASFKDLWFLDPVPWAIDKFRKVRDGEDAASFLLDNTEVVSVIARFFVKELSCEEYIAPTLISPADNPDYLVEQPKTAAGGFVLQTDKITDSWRQRLESGSLTKEAVIRRQIQSEKVEFLMKVASYLRVSKIPSSDKRIRYFRIDLSDQRTGWTIDDIELIFKTLGDHGVSGIALHNGTGRKQDVLYNVDAKMQQVCPDGYIAFDVSSSAEITAAEEALQYLQKYGIRGIAAIAIAEFRIMKSTAAVREKARAKFEEVLRKMKTDGLANFYLMDADLWDTEMINRLVEYFNLIEGEKGADHDFLSCVQVHLPCRFQSFLQTNSRFSFQAVYPKSMIPLSCQIVVLPDEFDAPYIRTLIAFFIGVMRAYSIRTEISISSRVGRHLEKLPWEACQVMKYGATGILTTTPSQIDLSILATAGLITLTPGDKGKLVVDRSILDKFTNLNNSTDGGPRFTGRGP